ncbi:MAG TPA: nucleotide exchange factor GrpE, partial [Candidatus Paceibacterota bacterium]|nr:nucleotide exchange factor GrpE [Candidatus Paceibacterota bacterium]
AFDPLLHEAVEGAEGDKLEEVRAGYTMHGQVIRPARVKIVK